jgi:hypothetical protein
MVIGESAEGGFYQLTNMAEKNHLRNIIAPEPH